MSRITRKLQSSGELQRAGPDTAETTELRAPPFAPTPTPTLRTTRDDSVDSRVEQILAGIRKLEEENRRLKIQLEAATAELEQLRKEHAHVRSDGRAPTLSTTASSTQDPSASEAKRT